MIKVFFLIFEPSVAWEKIALARRGIAFICFTNLLPLLLLATAAEGFGLEKWGKWQQAFDKFRSFTPRQVVAFEVLQFILLLASVFITALLILRVSQTFHQRQKYLEAFTATVYGLSPFFLIQMLNAAPTMSPWVTWGLGVTLSVWILYQGLPRIMMPDPTHAFGLYLSSVMVVIMTTAIIRVITGLYLMGYIDFDHSWLTRKIGHLLGQ